MPHLRTFSDTILVRLYVEVEIAVREERAIQIHVCYEHKPSILVSTMRAMDNLGLDIQQRVISCSNGFVMDIYRAEVEPLSIINPLDSAIKMT
jgi:UTP:GlnB (protein PII) uridylyltransferase